VGHSLSRTNAWAGLGWAVLLVDPGRQAQTFLRYRDVNYLNYCSSRHTQPSSVRMALLGAVRYGKPCVLDLGDVPVGALSVSLNRMRRDDMMCVRGVPV
jgi:hypothetical protein